MRAKGILKFIFIIILFCVLIFAGIAGFYINGIPNLVKKQKTIDYLQSFLSKTLGANVEITEPEVITQWSADIELKAKNIIIKNENKILISAKNPDLNISIGDIFSKNITVKNLKVDYLYANLSDFYDLPVFKNTKNDSPAFYVDIFKSFVDIKNMRIFYRIDKENSVKADAQNIKVSENENNKNITYNINANLCRQQKFCVNISSSENGENTKIIDKKQLVLNNSVLKVDKSKIYMNGIINFDGTYNLNFSANNFSVENTMKILDTQVVSNNLEDYFVYFKDVDGNYNFNVDINNSGISGKVKLNNLDFKLVPLENIPIKLTKGIVSFDNNVINLDKFEGFYNNKSQNRMDFSGKVKDYLKSVDTDMTGNAIVTDDFAKNYLSKLISYPLNIKGIAKTRVMLKSKNNKIDVTWLYMFKKGTGFIIDGEEPELNNIAHRVLVAKMGIEGLLLKIKSLDYHIADEKGRRDKKRTPILSLNGNIDFSDKSNPLRDLGLTLTQPMPSTFLNLIKRENIFKGGTFTGNMKLINGKNYPVLRGDLKADKVGIPSQRLYIRNGEFKSNNNVLEVSANGYYRKSKYDINAVLENKMVFPIIVKSSGLTLENIDVEKYMQALNEHSSSGKVSENMHQAISDANKNSDFDLANIIVKNCVIKIKNGNYKNINFSDVIGNLTLDKNSILTLKTNRFNVAEGSAEAISTNDLRNHKYNLNLAVMGVNSDLIASELVNLPNEIVGKASGILNLNTDKTLKLNGDIKFIVKDGVISKMGLVEYTMKVASLFRNPLVMVTPAVISDLVNVPEGKFDLINGSLKLENNVVRRLVIKSVSPQLSTFIVGRYNLHNQDAILRIYTKFSNKRKGAFGFLRSLSLNSLANRIPLSSKNNSNYYQAEISELPKIEAEDKDIQIFLTTVDGDIVTDNFISSLKKIK